MFSHFLVCHVEDIVPSKTFHFFFCLYFGAVLPVAFVCTFIACIHCLYDRETYFINFPVQY